MRQPLTIALLLTTLLPAAAMAQGKDAKATDAGATCKTDADCKGGRVCKAGACAELDDAKPAEGKKDAEPKDGAADGKITTGEPPPLAAPVKITDVEEKPGKTYYFIGLRYRGTIVPQFLMNLFVDGGRTVWNNTFGIEMDIRKDGFSIVPSLVFAEHGMAPTVFLEKGKDPNQVGNYSVVGSDIKGIYANVDLLWSAKLHKHVDFEYGFGVGVGVLFGDLNNNWVTAAPAGPNGPPLGQTFANNTGQGAQYPSFRYCDRDDLNAGVNGCTAASHNNSTAKTNEGPGKVIQNNNGKPKPYVEPYWSDGGPIPNVFLHLALPILGVRVKPIKQLQFRFNTGFSITGFFLNFSGDWGLERMPKPPPPSGAPPAKAFLGPYQRPVRHGILE
jgi:hypothetical protein